MGGFCAYGITWNTFTEEKVMLTRDIFIVVLL